VLWVTALLAASGCELAKCGGDAGNGAMCIKATSLVRYEGDALEPDAMPYTPGTDVSVHDVYGNIHVVEGEPGILRVKFEPFNYRAYDAESAAREEIVSSFESGFALTDTGFLAQTGRHDGSNGLGADVTLYLPPEFDARITAVSHGEGPVNPGDLNVEFAGHARYLTVQTNSLGDCTVHDAPSGEWTDARCDGDITITNVTGGATITGTGLGSIVTYAPIDLYDGNISNQDGDIDMTFPEDGIFYVSAYTGSDGSIDAPMLEERCAGTNTSDTSKTFFCGGADGTAPQYFLVASPKGGSGAISLRF